MRQKNKSEELTEGNNASGSKQQLKVCYSNIDVLITDKLNELKCEIDDVYLDIVSIAEVKSKSVIRTLSLVEYCINGYNLETINMLADEGKGMLFYIYKSIQYQLLDQFSFINTLTQEVVMCELKTGDSNISANMIVFGDFNYSKIDWVHYGTNCGINDSNCKFFETTRDCFF